MTQVTIPKQTETAAASPDKTRVKMESKLKSGKTLSSAEWSVATAKGWLEPWVKTVKAWGIAGKALNDLMKKATKAGIEVGLKGMEADPRMIGIAAPARAMMKKGSREAGKELMGSLFGKGAKRTPPPSTSKRVNSLDNMAGPENLKKVSDIEKKLISEGKFPAGSKVVADDTIDFVLEQSKAATDVIEIDKLISAGKLDEAKKLWPGSNWQKLKRWKSATDETFKASEEQAKKLGIDPKKKPGSGDKSSFSMLDDKGKQIGKDVPKGTEKAVNKNQKDLDKVIKSLQGTGDIPVSTEEAIKKGLIDDTASRADWIKTIKRSHRSLMQDAREQGFKSVSELLSDVSDETVLEMVGHSATNLKRTDYLQALGRETLRAELDDIVKVAKERKLSKKLINKALKGFDVPPEGQ